MSAGLWRSKWVRYAIAVLVVIVYIEFGMNYYLQVATARLVGSLLRVPVVNNRVLYHGEVFIIYPFWTGIIPILIFLYYCIRKNKINIKQILLVVPLTALLWLSNLLIVLLCIYVGYLTSWRIMMATFFVVGTYIYLLVICVLLIIQQRVFKEKGRMFQEMERIKGA